MTSIFVWKFKVDWKNPANTKITGPEKIAVAPYHYLCGGQLTNCVPQPGTERRLDAQGDKIMARLVYRKVGARRIAGRGALGQYLGRGRRRALVRVPHQQGPQRPPASTGHVCARWFLPLDGQPCHRPVWQHRHRLFVRRDAELRRPALRRAARQRPARHS